MEVEEWWIEEIGREEEKRIGGIMENEQNTRMEVEDSWIKDERKKGRENERKVGKERE